MNYIFCYVYYKLKLLVVFANTYYNIYQHPPEPEFANTNFLQRL